MRQLDRRPSEGLLTEGMNIGEEQTGDEMRVATWFYCLEEGTSSQGTTFVVKSVQGRHLRVERSGFNDASIRL